MINYHPATTLFYKKIYKNSENFAIKSNYFVDFEKEGKNKDKIADDWVESLRGFKSMPLLGNLEKRYSSILDGISRYRKVEIFSAVTDSRLVVGLGNSHIKETFLNLHHIYGIPFIPGSALKGICRYYVLSEVLNSNGDCLSCLEKLLLLNIDGLNRDNIFNELKRKTTHDGIELKEKTLKKAYNHISIHSEKSSSLEDEPWKELELARKIFGNTDQAGEIVFYDAFPQRFQTDMDIMNPHFGEYYSDETGKKFPTDDLSPIPIKFVSIASGSRFKFALYNRKYNQDEGLIHTAKDWLIKALKLYGVGAKTAVGYGFFKDLKDLKNELGKEKMKLGIKKRDIKVIENALECLKSEKLTDNDDKLIVSELIKLFTDKSNFDFSEKNYTFVFCNLGFDFLKFVETKIEEKLDKEKIKENLKKFGGKKLKKKMKQKSYDVKLSPIEKSP